MSASQSPSGSVTAKRGAAGSSQAGTSDTPTTTLSKAAFQANKRLTGIRIANRFKVQRRLGGGAFGDVYHAIDLTNNDNVAVKLEPTHSIHQPHLQHEAKLYSYMHKTCPISCGIPRCRWYGKEGDFNVMVMELLGPSLEDIFDFCGRQFDTKTVLMLADQMISRLEFMHALNYLHRDLKPENFSMGLGKKSHHCYIIDMGLAKRYRDSKTGQHIPYLDGKSLTGTARYVSINTHLGVQQSRRDDMEALALVLIYMARGTLPWQGVKLATKQAKYERIKQLKMQISSQTLCEKLPNALLVFLMYTRSLGFEDGPDYTRCRKLFNDELESRGHEYDYEYCWKRFSAKAKAQRALGSPDPKSKKTQDAVVFKRRGTTGGEGGDDGDTSSQPSSSGAQGQGTSVMSVSAHTDLQSVGGGSISGSIRGGGATPSNSGAQQHRGTSSPRLGSPGSPSRSLMKEVKSSGDMFDSEILGASRTTQDMLTTQDLVGKSGDFEGGSKPPSEIQGGSPTRSDDA